jgi:hypothetical protein
VADKKHSALPREFIRRLTAEEYRSEALVALWEASQLYRAADGPFKNYASVGIVGALADLKLSLARGDAKREKDCEIAVRERGGK